MENLLRNRSSNNLVPSVKKAGTAIREAYNTSTLTRNNTKQSEQRNKQFQRKRINEQFQERELNVNQEPTQKPNNTKREQNEPLELNMNTELNFQERTESKQGTKLFRKSAFNK